MRRDTQLASAPANMEDAALDRIARASNLVAEAAPGESEAFKEFILGVADAAAQTRNGVGEQERKAIEKIGSALA